MIFLFYRKLAKDAHGISITSDLDNEESREFGIINIGSHMQGERVMTILTILHNACDGGEQLIALTGCKLLDNSNEVFTIGNRNNNQVTFNFDTCILFLPVNTIPVTMCIGGHQI